MVVEPGRQAQPGLRIRHSESSSLAKTVRVGEAFTLAVETEDSSKNEDHLAIFRGEVTHGDIVICSPRTQRAGGSEMSSEVQFMAVQKAKLRCFFMPRTGKF